MSRSHFERYAWAFVAYLIAVILFGAWVRISGSGNGCGSHWPMCNGEVIPQGPAAKTVIEFTHRLTSGLCGVLGIILIVWARRLDRWMFRASIVTMFFLLVEGFIGAVLVKKELVAGDASAGRAIVIALHLTNTLMLVASAATVAWWSRPRPTELQSGAPRHLLVLALLALVLTNMSGAITALGDTLFPVQPALDGNLFARLRGDLSASQHFLVRLRLIHPAIAVLAAVLIASLFVRLSRRLAVRDSSLGRILSWGMAAVGVEMGLGVVNVLLGAPGWMQVLHLLAAQVLWVLTWLVTLVLWTPPASVVLREPHAVGSFPA